MITMHGGVFCATAASASLLSALGVKPIVLTNVGQGPSRS